MKIKDITNQATSNLNYSKMGAVMSNNFVSNEPKLKELKELVDCCPKGHNSLNLDCPFRNIRKLNDVNLEKLLTQMSLRQVDAIIDYHTNCTTV